MDHSNNGPHEDSGYGWRKSELSAHKRQDVLKRILIAAAGMLLIATGIFGVLGTIFGVSVTRPVEVPLTIQEISATVNHPSSSLFPQLPPESLEPPSHASFPQQRFHNMNGGTVLESQICLADMEINEISISATAAEIIIYSHDSDNLDISIEMHNDTSYDVSFVGLSVVIGNDDKFGKALGKNKVDQLLIRVPYSYDGSFIIKLAAGRADVSDLSGRFLNIETAAGDFILRDISYDHFQIDMAAGVLAGHNISAKDVLINMTAGTASLAGNLGTTRCKATAGSVVLDYNTMPESINIEATAGAADIFLPKDSKFRLKHSSVMGSISSDFESYTDAASEISINMAMGQANIHMKK